jgi:catechol 2,3-dioxygenase-like lactoylglutathione lyase family enzyme
MQLGAFSVSLNVKNIKKSKAFYETLGFSVFAGDIEQNYLIMKNGNALIGLFQGMFEKNILTFNPGWDENANLLGAFDDVRTIQNHLKNETSSWSAKQMKPLLGLLVLYFTILMATPFL